MLPARLYFAATGEGRRAMLVFTEVLRLLLILL